jgi:hypothetical protein
MSLQGNILYNGLKGSGSGPNPPGVSDPFVNFTVGDGQAGSPNNGDTFWRVASFQGQAIFGMRILFMKEGIGLNYNTPVTANGEIRRYNSGGLGGFTWEGVGMFFTGERYAGYIIGVDPTIEV